jgi:glycosyltransferase involved in cell wall biosynthesis
MLSVVIPAHNEAVEIERCLNALYGAIPSEDLEVVVVCNGCGDDTADRARAHPGGPTVLELDQASKVEALNAGDEALGTFPRLYLDADVTLDGRGAMRLADELGGSVLAAAPAVETVTTGTSFAVRSYLRIWSRLPSVRDGLAGRGAFVLSAEGRQRFPVFPPLLADDRFVDRQFRPDECRVLPDVRSRLTAPKSLRELLDRKTRVFVGNLQLADYERRASDTVGVEAGHGNRIGNEVRPSDPTAWWGVVRRSPARLVDLPTYLVVTLVAKRRARRRLADGDLSWRTLDQGSPGTDARGRTGDHG